MAEGLQIVHLLRRVGNLMKEEKVTMRRRKKKAIATTAVAAAMRTRRTTIMMKTMITTRTRRMVTMMMRRRRRTRRRRRKEEASIVEGQYSSRWKGIAGAAEARVSCRYSCTCIIARSARCGAHGRISTPIALPRLPSFVPWTTKCLRPGPSYRHPTALRWRLRQFEAVRVAAS